MEHDYESSQATTTSLSLSKNQEDGYLPENIRAGVLKILFPEEFNESIIVEDLVPEFLFGKQINSSYSTEKNSCISRISESDRNNFQTLEANFPFTDILGDKTEQLQKRLSFSNVEIGDEYFFPTDVGKEMLLKDEEDCAREYMGKNDATDISWSVCTRKSFVDTSLLDDDGLSKKQRYSVGEYIRKLSEPLSSISGEKTSQKVYFGCNASTPMVDKRFSFELTEISSFQYKHETPVRDPLYGDTTNLIIQGLNKYKTPFKDGTFFQMLLYSVKKKDYSTDYKYYIGTENYKNIKRLEAEERKFFKSVEQPQFASNCSHNSRETSFGFSHQFDSTILKNTTEKTATDQGEDSVTEKWIVKPQELTLDVNSKGCRLLLMSYSKTNLKFKTKFDSKITYVCPISGILPAKGEVGLRIIVSRYIKKKFQDDTEDVLIITCGKTEKAVPVKICRQQKSKSISLKDRSYICF